MTGYTLQLTNKADEDEDNIYKHITDRFGQVYAEKFRSRFIQS